MHLRETSARKRLGEEEDMQPEPSPRPNLSEGGLSTAAKAVVAAVIPLVAALLLWASSGTLDETELSVALTGLLTAVLVYFVPNTPGPEFPENARERKTS